MEKLFRDHIEKIVAITDDEFKYIMSHFSLMNFKKRDFLIREGEPVKYVFWVVSGLLKLDYQDASGRQHVVAFAMEDWWEGDYHAFFNQSFATMSLQALENTQVLSMTLHDYNALCRNFPKMTYFFLEKANRGHISSQQRILELISTNAKERYDKLLQRYPILFQRVPHTLIASYLGVTRETLSRLTAQ
ncbi:cAMP-binding domain of CRP or a regulatory subunit of cAMP-dependent protein kinases [Chryseobacterium soldanellicola]|uniref:cAMP-binding domain of CRP or a regulatory subunit of cAMP-dependent protein kinases n=1 Tax=Chryseobacterium soldanellicola TaxID=311333 RepID=A0A1H1CR84_9FLAO|nr:Crp/Fnr family transcriptional regulator [Chryseobacterium soldanellicola]SDQ66765.1 cAMP-binding domain of CRP or a regulatory subunit of cAMP-dependent protein kinases [Chryseobacterium soldanellicola]